MGGEAETADPTTMLVKRSKQGKAGAGAGLRGPEPSRAALCPPRVAVRGLATLPVGGGRDVLCVPGGENQRPPGEDRCPRVCQRRPFHPCAALSVDQLKAMVQEKVERLLAQV